MQDKTQYLAGLVVATSGALLQWLPYLDLFLKYSSGLLSVIVAGITIYRFIEKKISKDK